jgi:hypothetical protein
VPLVVVAGGIADTGKDEAMVCLARTSGAGERLGRVVDRAPGST